MVEKMIERLRGKKTYIVGACGVAVIFLNAFGVIDAELAKQLLTLLGFTGLVTLRLGFPK
jgi:small-conductance mechanosensitive channel